MYQDGDSKVHYVKRFQIETNTLEKRFRFIPESKGTTLIVATLAPEPVVEATLVKGKSREKQVTSIKLNDLIDVKGWKAVGNKFSPHKVKKIKLLEVEDLSKNTDAKPSGSAAVKDNSTDAEPAGVAVQASLFGEEELPPAKSTKAASKTKKKDTRASDNGKRNDDDDAFDIGATIELDL